MTGTKANRHAGESEPAKHRCVDCGCEGDGVTFEPDPYAEEIHYDDTPVWMCDWCRIRSARDV